MNKTQAFPKVLMVCSAAFCADFCNAQIKFTSCLWDSQKSFYIQVILNNNNECLETTNLNSTLLYGSMIFSQNLSLDKIPTSKPSCHFVLKIMAVTLSENILGAGYCTQCHKYIMYLCTVPYNHSTVATIF